MSDELRQEMVRVTYEQLIERLDAIERLAEYVQEMHERFSAAELRLVAGVLGEVPLPVQQGWAQLAADLIAAREHVAFSRIMAETLA